MHLIHVYGKKYERGSNWSEPEVLELLQIWSDLPVQTELVTCLRNQHVFNRIANILRQKGINRTGDQCREKIKKLKLEYKQKSLRCERYYQLMERAHGHRCAATSGSLPLWTQPPPGQQLLEVKTEVMSSDDDAAAEVQYEFGPAGEDHQAASKREDAAETQGSARDLCSTSDCSEPNTSGFSGGPVSSATAPVSLKDEGIHGDRDGEGEPRPYHQKKRRRRGSGGQLSSALSDYLSWQRAAEERLLALEEARLRQEARAEERWERREERRAQLDRQHELRLLSMLTQVLSPSRDVPANHTADSHESLSSLGSAPPPRYNPLLSERGNAVRMHQGILQEGYARYHADKHHEENNPHGIINLGTSENKLCYDLLQKRLTRPDMLELRPELLHYPDWRGHPMLREEVARFLSDYCRAPAPLSAQNVVVMNGCGSLFSALAAAICDPEDVFLIPSPFYGVITEDVGLYSGVRLHHVPLHAQLTGSDVRPFQLTVEKLEKSLTEARQEGSRVKGLVLINPHNPLGDVFSSRHISSFLHFAKKHHLHVIVDEIYMLSVFDQEFSSVLSLDELPDPQRTHVMWGVSKDLAMAGMRVGVLYSENRDLLEVLDRLGNFHGIPGPSQHQIATLLRDRDWLNGEFLPENRRRLREAHHFLSEELKKLEVPFLQRGAGFFIWADFSKYMRRKTSDEELRLWRCFLKHKLLLSCGQAFSCSSPGWFRIIFTEQHSKLKLGVHRLRSALQELQQDRHDWPRDSAPLTPSDPASSENPPLSNGQSAGSASSLDGLIGALRQQLHSCDWLERNRPDLSPGDDPQRLDTFTRLLDRARRC